MESSNVSPAKSALNYGAVLGLVLMVLSLLVFVLELYEASWINYISYAISIGGIVYGIKKHRDTERGGVISYGGALGYGTLIALFAGIIIAFVTYIYLGYVDDGFVQFQIEEQERQMYERGMADGQIEQSMAYVRKFSTPGVFAIFGVLGNVFMGFIISLIAAAFLKKQPEHFDDTE